MNIRTALENSSTEELEKKLLDLDDTFKFKCRRCGKCCKNQQEVIFTARDLFNIAHKKDITTGQAIKQYGEAYIGPSSLVPLARMVPNGPHGNCPLMNEDGRCSVHDCKPVVCALYPLGRIIMSAQPGAALEDAGEVRVKYIMNEYNCGSAQRTNTVRDWLARFHIPEHDEFFLQWNHLIAAISTAAHKLRDEDRERELRELWDFTFSRLYLNYDVHEDLKEQFERNSREVEDYLGAVGPEEG